MELKINNNLFDELEVNEAMEVDGGGYNVPNVLKFWASCYAVGYAVGEFIGNLRN